MKNEDLNIKMIRVLTHLAEFLQNSEESLYAEETPEQLLKIVNVNLTSMQTSGTFDCLEKMQSLFLPTASLQDISIDNGWGEQYIELSKDFECAISART